MADYTVRLKNWESAYSSEAQAERKLESLREQLDNVSAMLAKNSTTSKYCASVNAASREVSAHAEYVRRLKEALQEASALYENTDRQVTKHISQAVTAQGGFSEKTVALAREGLTSREESLSELGLVFAALGENREQAAALLQKWKEAYGTLSKEDQEAVEQAAKELLGDNFFDSLVLTDMIISGEDFEAIVKQAGDTVIKDDWYKAAWDSTVDYTYDETTLAALELMEEKAKAQIIAGDYEGALGTISVGFVDTVGVGSVKVICDVASSTGEKIGDFMYDTVQFGEDLGDFIYDQVHGTFSETSVTLESLLGQAAELFQ